MILNEEKFNVETNAKFESKQMNISPEFFNKIIWHVILQYKYKIRTSVQELISNAIDAQVDAGNTDTPLKIQLPTKLEPTFKLRDYGTGMTPEVMDKIYRNMGASGSSHTNKKKGGFGIGGKSPLGFTDQYNIKTYVNGTYWFYAIYKNAENGINVDLVETGKTSEPNGTEIQIPAKPDETNKFKEAACRATMFWDVQPKFNIESEKLFKADKPITIDKGIRVYTSQDLGELFDTHYNRGTVLISLDGIPYQLDDEMVRRIESLRKLETMFKDQSVIVLDVNVGDVKPLQTRESLEDCKLTIDGLTKVSEKALSKVEKYLEKQQKIKNLQEFIEKRRELSKVFRLDPYPFNSKENLFLDSSSLVFADSHNSEKKFEVIKYNYKSKSWGRYANLSNPRKHTTNIYSIDYDEFDDLYIDDIGDNESDILKARRLKYSIKDGGEVILISDIGHESVKLLKKYLSFKKLSDLPLPPKKPRAKAKPRKKLGQGQISINVFNRYGSRKNMSIDLSTNKTKYVYDDYQNSKSNLWQSFWRNEMKMRGYEATMIGKKAKKEAELNSNFITVEKFMENYTISNLTRNTILIKNAATYHWQYGFDSNELAKTIKLILKSGDKKLRKLAKELYLKEGYNSNNYNISQLEHLVDKKDLQEYKEKAKLFIKGLVKFYPKVKNYYGFNYSKNALDYINSKNKKLRLV